MTIPAVPSQLPNNGVTVPLYEYATTVLDQFGNGQAQVGPISAREVWTPSNVHVSADQPPVTDSQCSVFVGDIISPQNFRDQTFSGSSGDQTDACSSDIVKCGNYIFAVWSNGDAGVTATMVVTGTKVI